MTDKDIYIHFHTPTGGGYHEHNCISIKQAVVWIKDKICKQLENPIFDGESDNYSIEIGRHHRTVYEIWDRGSSEKYYK